MGLRGAALEDGGVMLADPGLDARALHAARAYLATLPDVERRGLGRISLHWSATGYGWARERAAQGAAMPYNVVADVDGDGTPVLVTGMDPRHNARPLSLAMNANVDYCASVRGRNSHGVGVSIAAMEGASPASFGAAPIDATRIEFLCAAAGALCAKYGIDAHVPEACYTHAEAALWDGYFGTGDDERWDLALLEPARIDRDGLAALVPQTGDRLRRRIVAYASALRPSGT